MILVGLALREIRTPDPRIRSPKDHKDVQLHIRCGALITFGIGEQAAIGIKGLP
jgi:hypothetical protein